jgi:hypothetical protein
MFLAQASSQSNLTKHRESFKHKRRITEREQEALGRAATKAGWHPLLRGCSVPYHYGEDGMLWVQAAIADLLNDMVAGWTRSTIERAVICLHADEKLANEFRAAWKLGGKRLAYNIIVEVVAKGGTLE